jgi:glutamate racemase
MSSIASPPAIGVFDSGVGGLSVLRAIALAAPHARLLYVADSGHAPYGERDDAFVQARSLWIADFLLRQGAQAIVIACNTATASAGMLLRERLAPLPVVGVEPGVKPAAALTRNGRIGVLATSGTLRSDKFAALARAHAGANELVLQACPGLAKAIEAGDLDAPLVRQLVETYCAPLRERGVDTVVLGCTHYPFIAHHIQAAMGPGVVLVDTAQAVARRTLDVAPAAVLQARSPGAQALHLWTSGPVGDLQRIAARWLAQAAEVAALPET